MSHSERYLVLVDDYSIVIDGHVSPDAVRAVVTEALSRPPLIDMEPATVRVWARVLTSCPVHGADADIYCDMCDLFAEHGGEWWDQDAALADPDAHAHEPGYRPLTVVKIR